MKSFRSIAITLVVMCSLVICGALIASAYAQQSGGFGHGARQGGGPADAPKPLSGAEFIKRFDRNDDGFVTAAEVDATHDEQRQVFIDRHDSDDDGLVSLAEFVAGPFDRFDTDGDGFISLDEAPLTPPRNQGPSPVTP